MKRSKLNTDLVGDAPAEQSSLGEAKAGAAPTNGEEPERNEASDSNAADATNGIVSKNHTPSSDNEPALPSLDETPDIFEQRLRRLEEALARGLVTFRGTDSAIAQMHRMLKLTDEIVLRQLGTLRPTAATS